ncbi:hypothetical protein Tco_1028271 [Tanacetum coccineum]|uniref:Uncharacterized protein n=1 Tax=Tanacetum coccineum TaxID=301880 RepID=A0ABQ5G1I5_9ASTR
MTITSIDDVHNSVISYTSSKVKMYKTTQERKALMKTSRHYEGVELSLRIIKYIENWSNMSEIDRKYVIPVEEHGKIPHYTYLTNREGKK